MIRTLAYITVGLLISASLGCTCLQQSDSSTKTEAASAAMTLGMKEWSWIQTIYNNDTTITPAKAGIFTLTFNSDDTVHVSTDCNRMNGSYSVDGRKLNFSKLAATRMYCPDSQETEFAEMLAQVTSFLFTPRGELVLELKFDSGQILFK